MAAYKAKTSKNCDALVMRTYDTIMQLCKAIELAGGYENIPAVRNMLANMKNYESLAGKYSMNKLGDAVRSLQPIKVIGRKLVNVSGN